MIIDPDRFLEPPAGRLWTPERNRDAWAAAFEALAAALAAISSPAQVIVVCGIQGAGKSTWADRQQPAAIVFDAALPGRRHRAPIVTAARRWHRGRTSIRRSRAPKPTSTCRPEALAWPP